MKPGDPVTVIKRDPFLRETFRYDGHVLRVRPRTVLLEARFNREDLPFQGILLKRGDRFLETYYSDRWYNIFEIHDRDDGALKGWYCNVTRPAVFEKDRVIFDDLALDLWVSAQGRQTVLDEDEYQALALRPADQAGALRALAQLQRRFARRMGGK